jgi:hypothetical protein
MEKKICSKCKIEKDFCEFHRGKTKDGYQYKCKECKKEYSKLNFIKENNRKTLWAKNNPTKVKESKQKYYNNNTDKEQFRNNQYTQNRKKIDIVFKLSCVSRTRLIEFLKIKNITKKNKTFNYIGCTPQFLKEYLETKFVSGMSWDNHGEWHIDHIIPLSSAKNENDVYMLCHYTNLQPLWAEDNLKKSNKIMYL